MPRPRLDTLEAALAHIDVLEDALAEFAPFAAADDVPVVAEFRNATSETLQAFRRDTLYCDMSMFLRAAELTEHRR